MSKNRNRNNRREGKGARTEFRDAPAMPNLHPDIKKSVWIVTFLGLTLLLILAAAGQAGPWGASFYTAFQKLLGVGYFFLPLVSFLFALSFFTLERERLFGVTLIGGVLFVLAGLGFIDIVSSGSGAGLVGNLVGAVKTPFGVPAGIVITFTALVASFLVTINRPLKLAWFRRRKNDEASTVATVVPVNLPSAPPEPEPEPEPEPVKPAKKGKVTDGGEAPLRSSEPRPIRNYVPPPLSLLSTTVEKPTIGDLQANANIIKRTLDSFGIPVEMGEINVGPTVTRYTLKPAEGVKISRITTLSSDLALALAAHPIRIEAPIPGKSLVGIEVPNRAAAIVRLGSLLLYPDFQKAEGLAFALGRNVQGDPIFPDIEKMPHLMIAGATGSGKSITIHDLIISLLYKNSPEMLSLILIDPKRVELSIYEGLPHLIAPVVTDNKRAMGALRWVIQEMDRRYQLLLEAGARDIKSYNRAAAERLPFVLVIIDELADLMSTYGREVEGSIIRLAQMARATGIHLVVSTQRPSVEVITGLIKANITSRIALQVASQIDSRTILDTAGAEKLLGHGDLLFVSAELSKPQRIQGAYLTEDEIKAVVSFIKKHNEAAEPVVEIEAHNGDESAEGSVEGGVNFEDLAGENADDDALYAEAVEVVRVAKKASASLLQRRLKVGYARAARLLDLMEEHGIVGPGEGAKPRDVYAEGGDPLN